MGHSPRWGGREGNRSRRVTPRRRNSGCCPCFRSVPFVADNSMNHQKAEDATQTVARVDYRRERSGDRAKGRVPWPRWLKATDGTRMEHGSEDGK